MQRWNTVKLLDDVTLLLVVGYFLLGGLLSHAPLATQLFLGFIYSVNADLYSGFTETLREREKKHVY